MKNLFHSIAFFGLAVSANELYRSSLYPAEVAVTVAPFTYDGFSGPLAWYGLNRSGNALCDMGKMQSPIDMLPTSSDTIIRTEDSSSITVDIADVKSAVFENIGSFVEVITNGTLIDDGKKYDLVEFHYHTPSEHRVNGEYMSMEQHFVFESANAEFAILTFFIDVDDAGLTGPLVHEVLTNVTKIPTPGDSTTVGPLYFKPLIKHLHDNPVYRYTGSITSPPCNEEVSWIISTKPIRIDVTTYKAARSVLKYNARYTQGAVGKMNLLELAAAELNGVP